MIFKTVYFQLFITVDLGLDSRFHYKLLHNSSSCCSNMLLMNMAPV